MRSIALAVLLTTAPIAGHAADINVVGSTMTFRGTITMGDGVRFKMNLMAAENAGMPVRTVRLNSPGGLVDEALQIARTVREKALDTVVVEGGMCASACFLPFAAGRTKTVEADARVGVHNATSTGGIGPDSQAGTLGMALFAQSVGVPAQVLGRMAAEPSVEMGWLSAAELRSMGATVAKVTADNDWTLQGTERYDVKASRALSLEMKAESKAETDAANAEAIARFDASPLHAAIIGDMERPLQ